MIRFFACRLLLIMLLFLPATLHATQPGLVLTDDLLLKLGDAFVTEGDYYRAITEYKKLLILFADSPQADTALFNIGMAYYQGEEYEPAVRSFATLRTRYPRSRHVAQAAYQQGLSLVKLHQPEKAAEAFAAATVPAPRKSNEIRTASFGMAIAAFDQHDLVASRLTLERFVQQNPQNRGVPQAKEAMALLDQNQYQSTKSPLLAGTLSALVPGSGHIYAGRYGDGITSLLLNGLFIAGTVVAIQQENYAVAGVTGLIGLPFYIGNIYGGVNAATKWNLGIKKDLRGKLTLILEYPF
jgi:tetratricopeptide (TPR) repeat protein